MEKSLGIQKLIITQQFNLKFSQLTRTKNSKRQIYSCQSCQGMGIFELPSELKKLKKLEKLEKPHEQDIIQLYSLFERMNSDLQNLKAENKNLLLLLQDKKGRSRRDDPQLQTLYQQKKHRINPIDVQRRSTDTNQKKQQETDKMEIDQKLQNIKKCALSLQQNVAIVVKKQAI